MITFAKELAMAAGSLCLKERETLGDKDLDYKNPKDIVTVADRKVEDFLISEIQARYPGHAIFGEETGKKKGTEDYRWIIDPIDGTTSYFHNQPFYCVSIALEKAGSLVLGVVYAPVLDQLFHAQAGAGAWLNGRPIRVSDTREPEQAVMATGFACIRAGASPNNLVHFNRIVPKLRDIRRFGSAAMDLCYVACGRLDGFWEMHLNLYDIAAGVLMVREAGGIVTDFQNGQDFPGNGLAAANSTLHPRLTGWLQPPYRIDMIPIFFGIIFCLSLAAGWAWGYVNGLDLIGYAVSMIIGGFIGSSIIALIFSWLYFFQKETDKEKITRLKQEINDLKGVKRLK